MHRHPLYPPVHTGVRARHEIQRPRVAKREARIRAAKRSLKNLMWPHVIRPRRSRSLDLGPRCHIGRAGEKLSRKYPGSRSCSVQSAVGDEDYTGHFTWAGDYRNASRYPNISDYAMGEPYKYHDFKLTYKRVWYAESAFDQGFYNFSFEPFFYELLRLIIRERLDYSHLFAPIWVVGETYRILRKRPICPCRALPRAGSTMASCFTFDEIRTIILSCADVHVVEFPTGSYREKDSASPLFPTHRKPGRDGSFGNRKAPHIGRAVLFRLTTPEVWHPNSIAVCNLRLSKKNLHC